MDNDRVAYKCFTCLQGTATSVGGMSLKWYIVIVLSHIIFHKIAIQSKTLFYAGNLVQIDLVNWVNQTKMDCA